MNNFVGIMQTLNEKKGILAKAYPDRVVEVERRINSRMVVTPSQYTLQRRDGYLVAQNVQYNPPYKRPRSESPFDISSPKKQKLEQGSSSQIGEYSPSQTPLRIDDEASLREQLRKIGGEGDRVVITANIERGVPKEPPVPSFDLTSANYRGKEIDPIIAQASHKFIDDENFVKSRAFAQFLWRRNIDNFEPKCQTIKEEKPNKLDSEVEEEVKAKILEDFSQLTLEARRQLVKESGVLVLLEWDIDNVMIFYSVRKEKYVHYKSEEEILQAHRRVKYSSDHQDLVIWSIEKRDKTRIQEISNAEHTGTLTVYREDEVDSEEINKMTREMVDFGTVVARK